MCYSVSCMGSFPAEQRKVNFTFYSLSFSSQAVILKYLRYEVHKCVLSGQLWYAVALALKQNAQNTSCDGLPERYKCKVICCWHT
jgi:hypothetical protein